MMTLAVRRWLNWTTTLIVCGLIVTAWWAWSSTLVRTAFMSGWTLLGLCLLLAAYNLRKKFAFLPLLNSASWLQVHLAVGFISIAVFAAHVGFTVPRGGLEITLAGLFFAVAVSGVIGLIMSRLLPRRLNTRGENIVYERLPVIRRKLRERAETIVLESVERSPSAIIYDHYRAHLHEFFGGPRHFSGHLVGSRHARHRLIAEIDHLRRYSHPDDQEGLTELATVVGLKDDLDFRHMAYTVLKGWLFVHIPLTYAMLLVAGVHVLVVHAFSGGTR